MYYRNQLKRIGIFCGLLMSAGNGNAQLPVCDPAAPGYVYADSVTADNNTIYNWNPFAPLSATNPSRNTITLPAGAEGLAVSRNINDPFAPSPTFYTSVGGNYYYYDGSAWVNTGHSIGVPASPNFGAGGGYIYNLDAHTGGIYRYDGAGHSVLLTTISDFPILGLGGGPYDVVADCAGNFYLLRCYTPAWLRKYDPAGSLLDEWQLRGVPDITSGAGFAITGNLLTLQNLRGLYSGTIDPASAFIDVTGVPDASFFPWMPGDFANCPVGTIRRPVHDTVYICTPGGTTVHRMEGTAPYGFRILEGAADVQQSGADFTIRPSLAARIEFTSAALPSCDASALIRDTLYLVPAPAADAGSDRVVEGCGVFQDTLRGALTGAQPWISYEFAWSPGQTIISGGDSLQPVIGPAADTRYTLTVTTPASHGGCVVSDTVTVRVRDRSVTADFGFERSPGCTEDTVRFINRSRAADRYAWSFGDGSREVADPSPVHIYRGQQPYSVRLIAGNMWCRDTLVREIEARTGLRAAFVPDRDTVCQQEEVLFRSTSESRLPVSRYLWQIGGTASSGPERTHLFAAPGLYEVMLVVTDSLGCTDTATGTIQTDSLPEIAITGLGMAYCEAAWVSPAAVYTREGLQQLSWDFGDATVITGSESPEYVYDQAGTYNIMLQAVYRSCGTLQVRDTVVIHPLPELDLGPDTSVCPQGEPLVLSNLKATPGNYRYYWSTGARTREIRIGEPGEYGLIIRSDAECTASGQIRVARECEIPVPNSFSPDGDGHNDRFMPASFIPGTVRHYTIDVYNRWGQHLYRDHNEHKQGWDGSLNSELQPAGVYVYRIEAVFRNGIRKSYAGNVTLIR